MIYLHEYAVNIHMSLSDFGCQSTSQDNSISQQVVRQARQIIPKKAEAHVAMEIIGCEKQARHPLNPSPLLIHHSHLSMKYPQLYIYIYYIIYTSFSVKTYENRGFSASDALLPAGIEGTAIVESFFLIV